MNTANPASHASVDQFQALQELIRAGDRSGAATAAATLRNAPLTPMQQALVLELEGDRPPHDRGHEGWRAARIGGNPQIGSVRRPIIYLARFARCMRRDVADETLAAPAVPLLGVICYGDRW